MEHFATPRETLCSRRVRLLPISLWRSDAVARWLKVHYLSWVIPWMSYAKLVVFHVVINRSCRTTFQHALFFCPSHQLLLKTNSQYLSGSPIKDLHCDSIFHFNYYTYCTLDVFPYLSNNTKAWNSSSKQIVRFSNCSFHFGSGKRKHQISSVENGNAAHS